MIRTLKASVVGLTGLWVGVLFCIGFVVAPYLFSLAAKGDPLVPHTGAAAGLIGPLIYGSDIAGSVVAVVVLAGVVLLRRKGAMPLGSRFFLCEIALGVALVCALVNYLALTPKIASVKAALEAQYGAYHLAPKVDPLRMEFGKLHGISTVVFITGLVTVMVALVCMSQFKGESRGAPAAAI